MKLVELSSNGMPVVQLADDASVSRTGRLHDKAKVRITLKQWRVLHAVIDCDGFTAAAERLHISQSAISYTIAKMQEQLGVPLLKMEGRKAQITIQGRALLECSRNVIRSALELEALAEQMRLGWEPELRLMVEHDCPQGFLMSAIRTFSNSMPHVKVLLQQGSAEQVEQAILRKQVELAIYSHAPLGLIAHLLTSIEYVAVVHTSHALACYTSPVTTAELSRHNCIVLAQSSAANSAAANGHFSGMGAQSGAKPAIWKVSDIDSVLAALEAGLGYAWLPFEKVRRHLDAGTLALVSLASVHYTKKDFYLVNASQAMPSANANSLSELLHVHAAEQKVDMARRA